MKSLQASFAFPKPVWASQGWGTFCFAIFIFKLFLFACDPTPKVYMGDSSSYIWTALSGWIPADRSYFYGYVIRWTAVASGSLTSLLVLQVSLSALTCILLAVIARSVFSLPSRWSYLFGFLCAIDPLQLLYERYVMTEGISLFLFAVVLHRSFLYLRDRRWQDLVLVQVISVVLIGFRISFLMAVQINTVLLPLLAFAPNLLQCIRLRVRERIVHLPTIRRWAIHMLLSVALMFLLHTCYKQAYGKLAHREPAYQYVAGFVLFAFFAPILEPSDGDGRVADLIARGDEYDRKNFYARNAQLFGTDHLNDRLSKIEPDPIQAEIVAKRTAMHALMRNPLAVLGLGWHTYTDFWSVQTLQQSAEKDFSFGNQPSEGFLGRIASDFHLALKRGDTQESLIQRYYVQAWPYYFIVLLAPFLSGLLALLVKAGRSAAILLFVYISAIMTPSMIFGGESIRYFQPISYLTLLVITVAVGEALRRRRTPATAVQETPCRHAEPKPVLTADALALTPTLFYP